MKSYLIKASVAAAMLVAGTLAQATTAANSLPISVAPGAAEQGGVATAVMTLQLSESYELWGVTFILEWPDGGLNFLPTQSSAGGSSYAALEPLFDPVGFSLSSTSHSFGLSTFFESAQVAGPDNVDLSLAFRGLQVGSHTVSYELDLADAGGASLYGAGTFNITITPVPEPATYALMLGGLAVVGALARRRSRAA